MRVKVDLLHGFLRYFHLERIKVLIKAGLDFQSLGGGCGGDEVDHGIDLGKLHWAGNRHMAENADRVRRSIHSRLPVPGGDSAGGMKEGRCLVGRASWPAFLDGKN